MSVPFSLAPMATLSHRALRELIEGFGGCDLYFTEMIGAGALLSGGRFEDWYRDPAPRPDKLVYQLVGADGPTLAKAAAALEGFGPAGIDLNMGCSAPEIVRARSGSYWMGVPDAARAMVAQVRAATRVRLSVKLRLGADDDFGRLAGFCRMLQDEGVEALTLHPRTTAEKLKRRARWEIVGRLRAELAIPVTGNGDVADAAGLAERAAGDCDGVMVGRSAVRAPWIFADARAREAGLPPGPDIDLEAVAERFFELLAKRQPPEFWETRARRWLRYFSDNFKWAHHVRTLTGREGGLSGMMAALRRHLAENPEERWLKRGAPAAGGEAGGMAAASGAD